jgi:hypothetical protein
MKLRRYFRVFDDRGHPTSFAWGFSLIVGITIVLCPFWIPLVGLALFGREYELAYWVTGLVVWFVALEMIDHLGNDHFPFHWLEEFAGDEP